MRKKNNLQILNDLNTITRQKPYGTKGYVIDLIFTIKKIKIDSLATAREDIPESNHNPVVIKTIEKVIKEKEGLF